jgi:hypothetical protein
MEVKEVANCVTLDKLTATFGALVAEQDLAYVSEQSLFIRGVILGMEVSMRAIAESVSEIKPIEKSPPEGT